MTHTICANWHMRFREGDFKDTERPDQLKESVDEKLQHPGSNLLKRNLPTRTYLTSHFRS